VILVPILCSAGILEKPLALFLQNILIGHSGRLRQELFIPSQTAFPTIFRPARSARSASPFKDSSQGTHIGEKTITDNTLRLFISDY
jgi:hypothetical protein